jgi:Ca2+-binding EF-hand superfamily protein
MNEDGKLSPAEFNGPAKLFGWIDADHDGSLYRPEATRAYLAIVGRLALAEKSRAFRAMDANHDGSITKVEYKGPKPLFARIDANHDGSITRAEGARALRGYVHRALVVAELKAMDTKKDGMISAADYKGPKSGFARLDVNNDGSIGRRELALVW